MNNRNIQTIFRLEQELETWLVKFDPQSSKVSVFEAVLDTGKMPLSSELEMRIRLDDRFDKNACLR